MLKKLSLSLVLSMFFVFQSFSQEITYTDLYKYLVDLKVVDLKGWKCDKPTGSSLKTPMGSAINAKRSCVKGDKSINAQILIGTMAAMAWTPFSMIVEYDSPDQFVKTKTIKGFKEVIMHDKSKDNPGGTIAVLLSQTAGAPNGIFVIIYENMDYKEAEKILEKYPLKQMAKVIK